jgi:hypothetical protein
MIKIVYIISALTLWFLSFFINAYYGEDVDYYVLYFILALATTILAVSIRNKACLLFLLLNLLCLVVPAEEGYKTLINVFDSSSQRFLGKSIFAIVMFVSIGGLFIYASVKIFRERLR